MPLFFFNSNQPDVIKLMSLEFDSVEDACAEAVQAAGESLRDLGRDLWKGKIDFKLSVSDEAGNAVCEIKILAKQLVGAPAEAVMESAD